MIEPIVSRFKPPFHLTIDVVGRLCEKAREAKAHTWKGTIHVLGKKHIRDAMRNMASEEPPFDLTKWNLPYEPANKHLTGLDPICSACILNCPDAEAILTSLITIVHCPMPPPDFGIMCDGGRHRAPSFAIFLYALIMQQATMAFYNGSVKRGLNGHGTEA